MFQTIRQNLRAFLRIPENISPAISASLPVASLAHPPEVSFTRPAPVAPVAPSAAAAPRFRRAPVDAEGFTAYQRKMQHEARLKTEFNFHGRLEAAGMDTKARRKVLSDFDTFVAGRPLGKAAPASLTENDEGRVAIEAPPADDVGDIVTQLEKCLEMLKGLHPDLKADDADADESQARACLARGDKGGALRGYDAAITKWGARIAAKNASSGLRLQPSSRKRATALIRQGFDSQPGVMALNASLSRAPRADFPAPGAAVSPALPVASHPAPAAASLGWRDRVQAIRGEIGSLDAQMRKSGIFDGASLAKQAALKSELRQLIAANRPRP